VSVRFSNPAHVRNGDYLNDAFISTVVNTQPWAYAISLSVTLLSSPGVMSPVADAKKRRQKKLPEKGRVDVFF